MPEKELLHGVDAIIDVNGEPVPLELHDFGNPLTFPTGRVIVVDEEQGIAASLPPDHQLPDNPHFGEIVIFSAPQNGQEVEE